jgi:hypothetical protein
MGGFSRAIVRGAWHVGQGHGGIVARGGESDEAIDWTELSGDRRRSRRLGD